MWDFFKKLNQDGVTIILTTHYLEEAESLCRNIAIINHGEIVAQDSTSALLARLDRKEARIAVDHDLDALPDGLSGPGVDATIENGREILVRFPPSQVQMGSLLNAVRSAGLQITDLSTRDTDLEEIFVALTTNEAETGLCTTAADPQAGPLEKSRTQPWP